ncbi:MAG TPA: tetratricopeptide repeat protein [Candidatus Binatia bacterium]|jgi:tetratricopeptide (TPR) repeat protein
MQSFVRRHRTALAFALIAALGFIAYANGLRNGFHFDDYEGIRDNPALRDLKNIPGFFIRPVLFRFTYQVDWRPILQITYALNYAIGGSNSTVYHATDLLFHIVAACMIFLIAGEILNQSEGRAVSLNTIPAFWIALAPALLFVVHTVNTQTVNYSWARSSLLAALFYMIAVYCHMRGPFNARSPGGTRWHAGALIAFALGLATKATAVSLPAMLLAHEILLLNPAGRSPVMFYVKEPRRLLKHLPTAAILIAYLWLRLDLTPGIKYHVTGTPWVAGGGGGRKTYLLTQLRAWVYYLKLYLWPDPLIFDYSSFGWSRSLADTRVLISLAIIAAIVIGAWLVRKRDPLLTFGVAWFFIALLPEASIFVRPDAVTGHRPYLAYAGLSIAAVLFAVVLADIVRRRLRPTSRLNGRFAFACGAALAVAVAGLTAATIRRNLDWRDDLVLWTDVLKKDPDNIRALIGLGLQYGERADYMQARRFLDEAIRLAPRKAEAYLYRGNINILVGDYDAALADLNNAVAKRPWLLYGHIYRGDTYRETGRYDDAEKDYQTALRMNPDAADAYYGIALVYWKQNRLPEATAACRKLLELERENSRSYVCLGSLLMHQGMFSDAMKIYYNGVTRFPENGTLRYGLGTAYEELGLYKEAQHSYEISSQLAQESEKDSGE